jgi:uncharacterized spore protein YtfJ
MLAAPALGSGYLRRGVAFEKEIAMEVSELLDKTRGDINARRVFGEPIQHGDAILIPAARVSGGGGGGEGKGPEAQGSGSGSGFGLSARPVGAFVLRNGHVRWRPAIDVNRVIMGMQIVVATGLLVLGRVLQAREHRRTSLLATPKRKRLLRLLLRRFA